MPDVERQLRDYFDAAVERITPEDVVAACNVATPVALQRRRRSHPAWAGGLAFAATAIVLGASLAAGTLTRHPDSSAEPGFTVGAGGDAVSVAATSWLLVVGVALIVAVSIALVATHGISTKENLMATTVTPPQRSAPPATPPTNRRLIAVIVILALALVGLAAWIVFDRASEPDLAPTAEVEALLADYEQAWRDLDGDALLSVTTDDYRFTSQGQTFDRQERASTFAVIADFDAVHTSDPVMVGDGPYYVTFAEEITVTGTTSPGVSTFRIVETADGLRVAEHAWVGDI